MSIRVEQFEFDDNNIEELWNHGISPADVEIMVGSEDILVLRNKRKRAGEYKFIGKNRSGHLITVVVAPVSKRDGVWRPITGWPSSVGEESLWRRKI